ncbi:MAG: hypothetical protein NXY59_07975 [Aigarchaeota archaeon]|nr:hypothetical protein [Candidatus Pelearchaeum maunauluense]
MGQSIDIYDVDKARRMLAMSISLERRGVPMVAAENLWRGARQAAQQGQNIIAEAYVDAALQLLKRILKQHGIESAWFIDYLQNTLSLLRRINGNGHGRDAKVLDVAGDIDPIRSVVVRLAELYASYLEAKDNVDIGFLERLSARTREIIDDIELLLSLVVSDTHMRELLRTVQSNLGALSKIVQSYVFLTRGVEAARSHNFSEAAYLFERASEVLGRPEFRQVSALHALILAYSTLIRAEAGKSQFPYLDAAELFRRAAESCDESRERYMLSAHAALSRAAGYLHKAIATKDKASLALAERNLRQAYHLYTILSNREAAHLCKSVLEALEMLGAFRDAVQHDGVIAETMRRYADAATSAVLPGNGHGGDVSLKQLVKGMSIVDAMFSHAPSPPQLPPLFMVEPPDMANGYLVAKYENGDGTHAIRLLNIGASTVSEIFLEGVSPRGRKLVKDILKPLESTVLRVEGSYEARVAVITYRDRAGMQRVLLIGCGATQKRGGVMLIKTGVGRLDEQLGGGIPYGEPCLILFSDNSEVSRLIHNIAMLGDVNVILATTKPLLNNPQEYGENVRLVIATLRGEYEQGGRVMVVKNVDDLTLLSRAIIESLESFNGDGKNKLVVLDVLSDVLLVHKLLITRRWLLDVIQRIMARGRDDNAILVLMNSMLHSREEVYGIKELFSRCAEMG